MSRKRAFEIGEALLGRRIRAEALPAPFGDRMQRCVLQELRGAPLDPGVRRLRKARMELLDKPRLAEARLADDQRELAFARPRALPAALKQAKLLLAADERRQATARRPFGPPPLARTMRKSWTGRGHALEFARTLILRDEKPRDLPLDRRR